MSKQSKFPGTGRAGNTLGNVPAETRAPYTPSNRGNTLQRRTGTSWGPGDSMGTQAISSHNSIGAFQRGVKSRGPYGGPSFDSLAMMKKNYQRSTPSSEYPTPSGGGRASSRGRTVGATNMDGGDYNNPMKENRVSAKDRVAPEQKGGIRRGHGTGSGRL